MFWGAVRRPGMDRSLYPRLPPARLENARVLTDRYDVMQVLPKGAVFAVLGAAAEREAMAAICAPARLLAYSADVAACSLDVAWLEPEESYSAVRRDLALLHSCLKPDGWIVVGLYAAGNGIIQSVHEFIVEQDYELLYLALGPAMRCTVALRRIGVAQSLRAVMEENAALRAGLDGMHASASWRMTAPLRGLLRCLRGG